MNIQDLRPKTADELTTQLLDLKKEAFNLRFQRASGQLENTARVREVRRDIARIKTLLGEKQSAGPEADTKAKSKAGGKKAGDKKAAAAAGKESK